MRVFGIDPGTRVIGYGVIEMKGSQFMPVTFGVIRASMGGAYSERLRSIYDGLSKLIAEHSPDMAAIEEAFYGKSVQATLRMGEGRGVAIVAAATAGIPVFEYSPAEVKKAVVGNGRAHKTQVQEMVRVLLGLPEPPTPDDAADALAVAICHCNRAQY